MKRLLQALCLLTAASSATAQDFYDPNVLRTVDLAFHDANWLQLLEQYYDQDINILADVTVEGVTYPDCGVQIRGNTSYFALPPSSEKYSLNVETDEVHPEQRIMGMKNFNFNNAFSDPTFCREVVYFNQLAEWIPSGRANHINLTCNGQNWGVYVNAQQYDKTMLKEFFPDEDGMIVKIPNNPGGPGLQYVGTNPSSYPDYELKHDGGLANPFQALLDICFAVDNVPGSNWQLIDQTFAIDPSIWTVVMENLYSDDDSYVNKGADFMLFRNPIDGRAIVHQTDGNESWTHATWAADFHFTQSSKPVLNNVLSSAEMRGRYMAHLRAALTELDWTYLGPKFQAHHDLIDAAVAADPKRIYSYQNFKDNFTQTVQLSGGGPFGQNVIGLKQYVDQRRALLLSDPEVAAVGPTVTSVTISTDQAATPLHVTADITGPDPIASAYAYYRPTPDVPYSRVAMADDGLSGDGAAGDGVYGALLPFQANPGQTVAYYVGATAQNTYMAQAFSPTRTENDPLTTVFIGPPAGGDLVINEILAQNNTVLADEAGQFEDYVELYNRGTTILDLSGLNMSDDLASPTEWQIPAGTTLAPGETLLIWADEDLLDGPMHADFKLSGGGEEVVLFSADGTVLLDHLIFGAQQADVSTGRLTDGGTQWVTYPQPTPGTVNDPGTGIRLYDQLDPTGHPIFLTASGTAAVGTTVTFTATNCPLGAPMLFTWGLGAIELPVDQLVLLVAPAQFLIQAADATGTMSLPVGIPGDAALAGLGIYAQVADVQTVGAFQGSNGVHLVLAP